MEDNLYPNDGGYFTLSTPEEQTKDDATTKADVFAQAPVIQAILDHLTERIAFYSSIESIDEPSDPAVFMHIVAANRIVLENLIEEKEALELLVKEYK